MLLSQVEYTITLIILSTLLALSILCAPEGRMFFRSQLGIYRVSVKKYLLAKILLSDIIYFQLIITVKTLRNC